MAPPVSNLFVLGTSSHPKNIEGILVIPSRGWKWIYQSCSQLHCLPLRCSIVEVIALALTAFTSLAFHFGRKGWRNIPVPERITDNVKLLHCLLCLLAALNGQKSLLIPHLDWKFRWMEDLFATSWQVLVTDCCHPEDQGNSTLTGHNLPAKASCHHAMCKEQALRSQPAGQPSVPRLSWHKDPSPFTTAEPQNYHKAMPIELLLKGSFMKGVCDL